MAEPKKGMSRRDFIVAGSAIVGLGAVRGIPAIPEMMPRVTYKEAPAPAGATLPPASESYLVVDSKKCSGCLSCMMACSVAHEGAASLSAARLQITQNSLQPFPIDLKVNQCRQCTDPVCVTNCPTGAAQVDTAHGNVRVIDQAKCIGCQTCLKMCPHAAHRTVWDAALKKAAKCDLCTNAPYYKAAAGKPQQACVAVCPMNALSVVKAIPDQTDDRGYDVNLRKA